MKKTIPFMISVLAIASIASITVLGNTQTAYAGTDCGLSPDTHTDTLNQGETSENIVKVVSCDSPIDDVIVNSSDCADKGIGVEITDTSLGAPNVLDLDEEVTNIGGTPGETHCEVTFTVEIVSDPDIVLVQQIWITTPEIIVIDVGGEFLPIDSTSLVLAAAQAPAAWLTTLTIAALGIGAYVFTRNPSNMRNIKVILRDYLDRF